MKTYTSPKEGIGLYCVFKTVDSGERLSIYETQTEETGNKFLCRGTPVVVNVKISSDMGIR